MHRLQIPIKTLLADQEYLWGSTEKASDLFASNFTNYVIGWIWPSGITLDWIQGSDGPTMIAWTS
jgi:hypothetical protein